MDVTYKINEIAKCMSDPLYFLDNYGYAFNAKTQKIAPLECFEYQRDAITDYEKYTNNLILKSRQTGFSVITAGYIAWRLLFKSDEKILIIANDFNGAKRLLKTVKDYVMNVPDWLLPEGEVKNNESYLELSNNSFVKALACSPQAGRGESLTLLVLDEVAFIENAEDIKAGALMAVSQTKGKTIMVSTPNGTNNLYYDTYKNAIKGENDFNIQVVHWKDNPLSNPGLETRVDSETGEEYPWSPWYQEQCERLGFDKVKIAQELDLSFDSSKYLAVDVNIVNRYKKDVEESVIDSYFNWENFDVKTNEFKEDPFVSEKTPFWIYKRPNEDGKYIIAADVARGDGKDYSTIQVLDAINLEQVAEFQSKITSDKFAEVILPAAIMYNNAYVAIEANNMGLTTCYYLNKTHGYKNVHRSKSIQQMQGGPRDKRWSVDEGDEIPGFQTTSKTRPFLIDSLRRYMREKEVSINSPRIMSEFETFVIKENGKAEHEKGCHDDLIIAFAIALFIRDSEWERVNKGLNMYKAMLSAWSSSRVTYRGEAKKTEKVSEKKSVKEFHEKEKSGEISGYMPIMHGSKSSQGLDGGVNFEDDDSWLYD